MPKERGFIKVGRMPGKIMDIEVDGAMTVEEALQRADMPPDNCDIRVNGQVASLQTTVEPGETVMLLKNVKGN